MVSGSLAHIPHIHEGWSNSDFNVPEVFFILESSTERDDDGWLVLVGLRRNVRLAIVLRGRGASVDDDETRP